MPELEKNSMTASDALLVRLSVSLRFSLDGDPDGTVVVHRVYGAVVGMVRYTVSGIANGVVTLCTRYPLKILFN